MTSQAKNSIWRESTCPKSGIVQLRGRVAENMSIDMEYVTGLRTWVASIEGLFTDEVLHTRDIKEAEQRILNLVSVHVMKSTRAYNELEKQFRGEKRKQPSVELPPVPREEARH